MGFKKLTLHERIQKISRVQAKRFEKLNANQMQIAAEGILKHFIACNRTEVDPDESAIREIIDDAIKEKRVFEKVNDDQSDI